MTEKDSVQGLIDFVTLVKPFHTKIIEVLIEHEHQEKINTTINDSCLLDEDIEYVQSQEQLILMQFGSNDDQRTHGDPVDFLLISPNVNYSFVGNSSQTQAVNITNKAFVVAGDQRQYFHNGDVIEAVVYHDQHVGSLIHIDSYLGNVLTVSGDTSSLLVGNIYYAFGGTVDGEVPFTITNKTSNTITVLESPNDDVIGKYFGLQRVQIDLNVSSNLFTIQDVVFNTGTLNSWPGYPNITSYQLGLVPHTIVTVQETIDPQPPYNTVAFTSVDGNDYSGYIIPIALPIVQMITEGTSIIGIVVLGDRTAQFKSGFQFDIVGGNCENLYTTMSSYESGGQTFVLVAERYETPLIISLGAAKIHQYGLNQYSSMRPHVPHTNVECYIRETLLIELDPPL